MGKHKDFSEFDKGQIVMVRWLSQSVSKTAALVGCSPVCSGQYLLKVVQGRNSKGLLMHVGSEGCPGWSDRTDTLLLLKLLKKLMLALIERCQNTQCITVCWVWGCIAAEQSGWLCWPLSTTECTNNGHVSIRNGTRSNWRRWPGLMNHIFFYTTLMAGCASVAYLGNTKHQGALWEEGKPAEAVWGFGQCSAGKPWVLPSMWMLLWQVPPT